MGGSRPQAVIKELPLDFTTPLIVLEIRPVPGGCPLLNERELTTQKHVRWYLDGTEPVAFGIRGKDERTLGPRN